MDISEDSDQSLVKKCFEFCSALTDKGCKYSFSLKLGQSFNFSLKSEQGAPPKAKTKRSQSYLRRQHRRREDFLRRRSGFSPENVDAAPRQDAAEKAAGQEEAEGEAVDTNIPLNLCPKPVHPRLSAGSMESEDDNDDEIQRILNQWRDRTEKSVSASHSVRLFGPETEEKGQIAGSEDQMGPPVAPRRSPEEPEGDQWTSVTYKRQSPRSANVPVSPVRQIPASHSTWAKPLLTDCRHSIWSDKSGSEMIVFAPPEVSYDDVIKAMKTPIDWRYFRPTSHRYDKWVFYPMENAENV